MYPVYALFRYFPEEVPGRILLTLLLLSAGIVTAVILYKKGRIAKGERNLFVLLWVYTLCVLFITVIGRFIHEDFRAQPIPLSSYRSYLMTSNIRELWGIILNVLMFVPLSFLTAQLLREHRPVRFALLCSILLTLTIEALQYVTRTGTFEVDDLIHNTLGALIGIGIWLLFRRLKRRKE